MQQHQKTIKLPFQITYQTLITIDINSLKIYIQSSSQKLSNNSHQQKIFQHINTHIQQLKFQNQLSQQSLNYYHQSFIKTYFIIKLNSLSKNQSPLSKTSLTQLVNYFNSNKQLKIIQSNSEKDIIYQIIHQSEAYKYLTQKQLESISQGQTLAITTLYFAINRGLQFTKKMEIVFSISFIVLQGRPAAFTSIVHKQKNHKGQLNYAQRIGQLVKTKNKNQNNEQGRKVQDPYSMRCSPHVHGVVYDTIDDCIQTLNQAMNGFLYKNLLINGQQIENLDLLCSNVNLKLDFLMASLQQIGSMSFLRSERMLNSYLGRNNICNNKQSLKYKSLESHLQRVVSMVGQNKIISASSNGDSITYDSYKKDIYTCYSGGYNKWRKIMFNLERIMHLQLRIGLNVLEGQNQSQKKQILNEQLINNLSVLKKLGVSQNCSLQKLKQQWLMK